MFGNWILMTTMFGFGLPVLILAVYKTIRIALRRKNQKQYHQAASQNQKHKNQQSNLKRITRRAARTTLDFSSDSDFGIDDGRINDDSRGRRRYKRVVNRTRTFEKTYSHQPYIQKPDCIVDSGQQRGIMKTTHQAGKKCNQRKHVTFEK